MRLGADDALPTPTFGERVVGEDAAALTSDAVYQELDEKAIERLQKIREEGLAKAVEETAEEKLDVEENGEEKEDSDKGAKTQETPDAASDMAKAPDPEVKEPVKVASVPPQPDPNRELDLGYDSKINLGAVYVPSSAPQRR